MAAMRRASAMGVLISNAVAAKVGLSPVDLECLDYVVSEGAVTAGQISKRSGLTTGAVTGLIDRVRFLCTVYDPNLGRYRVSYAITMGLLAGLISLGTTAVVISRAWLNSRRS